MYDKVINDLIRRSAGGKDWERLVLKGESRRGRAVARGHRDSGGCFSGVAVLYERRNRVVAGQSREIISEQITAIFPSRGNVRENIRILGHRVNSDVIRWTGSTEER